MAVRAAQEKIAENPVFLYTKRGCSTCQDLKRYLDKEYGRNKFKFEELDKLPGMEQTAIEDYLDATHGGHSLPRLFIKGAGWSRTKGGTPVSLIIGSQDC